MTDLCPHAAHNAEIARLTAKLAQARTELTGAARLISYLMSHEIIDPASVQTTLAHIVAVVAALKEEP